MIKTVTGFLATDSDGWQYLHKFKPKRVLFKKKKFRGLFKSMVGDLRNINQEKGEFEQHGEWLDKRGFNIEAGLHKFLLGKDFLEHKWEDEPTPITITLSH